jgi:hypothetical protein
MEWLESRPYNFLRILAISNQLLIIDLVNVITPKDDKEMDCKQLVKVVDQIKDLYKNTLEFLTESYEIKTPEGFGVVHKIQSEWVYSIQDGVHQMLSILRSVAEREKNDFSPLERTVTFKAFPRMDEFVVELERLRPHTTV